jgi:hypothetical protein
MPYDRVTFVNDIVKVTARQGGVGGRQAMEPVLRREAVIPVARWHQHQYWSALVYVSRIGCAIIAVGWLLHGGC